MRISDWSSDVCSSDLADVVVVNHHLLFADLALKQEGFGEILPGAAAFILDEAHQIPELAGQFFSQSVSARQLTDLAQDALTECSGVTGANGLLLEPVEALQAALRKQIGRRAGRER